MPSRLKVDLSNPKKRDALPARSSYYAHPLGSKRYVLMRKGARGSVWGARVPGQPDRKLGPVEAMDFDQVADLVRHMGKAEVTEEKPDSLVTFVEAFDAYLAWAEKTKAKQPYAVVKSHIKQMDTLRPMIISTTPKRVLAAWCNDLLTDRRGPVGANKIIGTLKAALNAYDVDGDWKKLRKFDEPKTQSKVTVLSRDKVRDLLNTLPPELAMFARAMWLVGARPGEIRTIVPDALNGVTLALTGKNGTRHITLTPAVADWSENHVEQLAALRWTRDQLDYRWKREKTGITMYVFRHSFITQALYANVPIFAIAKHTGTSPEMIMKTYGHVIATLKAEAFKTMETVLL